MCLPGVLGIFIGCSLEPQTVTIQRAHDLSLEGVTHPRGLRHGARYCQNCHGLQLAGGDGGEPSCYQCHGELWDDDDPAQTRAPDDHTQVRGDFSFMHREGQNEPLENCTSCHGGELQGGDETGPPSCFLCHDQLWP